MPDADKLVHTLPVLPAAEIGLSYVRTFDRHRYDLLGVGVAEQRDPKAYRWDNAARPEAALLQLTLAGEGVFADDRRVWRVLPGQAFLAVLPSATRYGLPDGPAPRWRFVWAMLAGDAAIDHARRILDAHGPVLSLGRASAPQALLLDLHRRVTDARGSLDELTLNVEVHRLLLELERALTDRAAPPPEVTAALQRIAERFADPSLDIDELADAAGYSRYHFSRRFKQHTGVSPYQHLLRVRMQHALHLLTTTDLPVKHVAARVGFNDVSWFCSAFRRHVRATPASLRKQRRRLALQHVRALP